MQRSINMKVIAISTIWAVVAMATAFIHVGHADPAPIIGVLNPCPPGYNYSHQDEASGWQVCIASDLAVTDDEGSTTDEFASGCPMVNSGDFLQAWNPDAGICFVIENETTLGMLSTGGALSSVNDVFTVSRDASTNQLLIDLHENLTSAECVEGASKPYLVSPNGVYCIRDMDDEYNFSDIENMAEAYFELVLECLSAEDGRIQTIFNDYEWYLEFAYYSNPNIRINWDLSANRVGAGGRAAISREKSILDIADNTLTSQKSQVIESRQELGYRIEEPCGKIVLRKIIGVTNY